MAVTLCRNSRCRRTIDDSFAYCPYCGTPLFPPPKPKTRRRPKGSGSIVKLSGNRKTPWQARKNGISLGTFATRPEAEAFLASLKGEDPSLQNLTLRQIYDRYCAGPEYDRLAPRSQKNVRLAWAKLEPLAARKMRSLVTTDYQRMIDQANGAGTGRDGCAKIRSLVSALCREAMKDLIIDRNFGELLSLPQRGQTVERRNFTDEEIVRLFYAEEDRDARIVLTMLYTALRIDELFSIRKADVDTEQWYMTGGEKTAAGRNRTIPIRKEIQPYIVQFLLEPGSYLISSPRGKKTNPNNWRERSFYPLLDRLGIDYKDADGNNVITPHRARHTYISESIAAGIKPEALIKIVGHASYKTSVETYDKVANLEFLQREAQKGL